MLCYTIDKNQGIIDAAHYKEVFVMIKIIMGLQGHGKTKQIIELANRAIENESNCVVCIERGSKPVSYTHLKSQRNPAQSFSTCQSCECFK